MSEKKYQFEPIAINLLFLLLCALFTNIRFETNEDEAMMQIVSGMFGDYEPHMVFINSIIGYLLVALYQLIPGISWYPVLMVVLLLVGFCILSMLLYKRSRQMGRVFTIALLLSFGLYFYTSLQFTEVAGLLALAGLLLLWDVWHDYSFCNKRISLPIILLSALLFALGSLYRFHCACLIYPISMLYAASLVKKSEMKNVIRFIVVSVSIVMVGFALHNLDRSFYNASGEWKYYSEYNAYRASLTDYHMPDYEDNQKLYDELGIDEEDVEYFKGWNFNDGNVWGLQSVKKISALNEGYSNKGIVTREFLRRVFNGILGYRWISGYVLSISAVILFCKKMPACKLLILQIIGLFVVELYFFLQGRYLQSRVDICIFAAVSVINYMVALDYHIDDIRIKKYCPIVLIIALLSFSGMECNLEKSGYNKEFEECILDKEHLYIFPTLGVDIGEIDIWRATPRGTLSNIVSTGGWGTFAPFTERIKSKYGIDNMFSDCINNDKVYFVSSSQSDGQIADFVKYINRHYDEYACATMEKAGDKMNVYRIESKRK